jgi:L-lactate utilization protein LutB
MLPILLMEPGSAGKRRRLSNTLLRKKQAPSISIDDIKKRLKDIRRESIADLEVLIKALTTNLATSSDVSVSLANDASQAVEIIRKISGTTKIAINKSTVVSKEIMPQLAASGIQVIETYYDQFEPLENIVSKPEPFPTMELSTVFNSFDSTVQLGAIRKAKTQKQGSKNFTGLLGVNAISAEDGSVVMLQHMHNISKVFEQAKTIILVAGLDKIVKNQDDAVHQTRSMAIFGWQALPSSLQGKGPHKDSIDNLPFDVSPEQTDQKIHIILLDNGRRQLLTGPNKDILACISCRACIKDCPAAPFFKGASQWNPREYLYALLSGETSSFEPCLQCKTCQMNCPVDIDLPGMILEARKQYTGKNRSQLLTNIALSNFETIAKLGDATSPLSNMLSNLKSLRHAGEKMMNISSKRKLPEFQRKTFAKWFRSRKRM